MATNPLLGDNEYVLSACPSCGQRIMLNVADLSDRRDVPGNRHVCGDRGVPLQRSHATGLEPLGRRGEEPLRKSVN